MNWILNAVKNFPPQWAVLLLSALPITELRLSLPLALEKFNLPVAQSVILCVIGTMIPAVAIVYLFEPIYKILDRHSRFFHRFFEWLFDKTRKKFAHRYEKFGLIALVFLAAVPLPFFGSYTAAVAAWLFGISPKKSLPLILIGVIIMAVIVLLLTLGVVRVF